MSITPSYGTYTPGFAKLKLLTIAGGLLITCFGLSQIWTPLRLIAFGHRTWADATQVIKAKAGSPDQVLTTDLQVEEQKEPRNPNYVFWNEFRFRTEDGQTVDVRATVGSRVQPLYKLIDADGLPTSDVIYYDPAHPETVVFPLIISTWFAPGVLIVIGLLTVSIGSFLYYWADKPIELPHIPTPGELPP